MQMYIKTDDILIDIKEVIQRVNSIQPDKRKVEIITEGKKANISYDKKLFSHAFSNLVENAFKFSRKKPAPKVIVNYNNKLQIEIIDYGRGIPEKDISKLFQPFFRSESTQDIEGTGLGLVICKRYIELQSGTLDIKSEVDVETKFTLSLPLER